MSGKMVEAPWRLAFRGEGRYINAYCADRDTMEGAVLLGSLLRTLADAGMFTAWREFMQEAFTAAIKEATGIEQIYPNPPQPAPEHERSGNA